MPFWDPKALCMGKAHEQRDVQSSAMMAMSSWVCIEPKTRWTMLRKKRSYRCSCILFLSHFIGFLLKQFSGKLALTVECGWLLVGGSPTSVDNPVYKGLV